MKSRKRYENQAPNGSEKKRNKYANQSKKPEALSVEKKFLTTDEVIAKIRAIAKILGWAIGVHGSLKRDIDLIAVPWTNQAVSHTSLLAALRSEIGSELGAASSRPFSRQSAILLQRGATYTQDMAHEKGPQTIWNPPAIDISFMDPRIFKTFGEKE